MDDHREHAKKWAFEELRTSVRRSFDKSGVEKLTFGRDFAHEACKRERIGNYFTEDDMESTRLKKAKMDKYDAEVKKRQREHEQEIAERWDALRKEWDKSDADGFLDKRGYQKGSFDGLSHEDGPGLYMVSQNYIRGPDTYNKFLCFAACRGDARSMHPDGSNKDACEYTKDELTRCEEWASGELHARRGPAPPWFLGNFNSWVHGAHVEVERWSVGSVSSDDKYGVKMTEGGY